MGLSMPVPPSTRIDLRFIDSGDCSSSPLTSSRSYGGSSNASEDAEDCDRRTLELREAEVAEVETEDVLCVFACPYDLFALSGRTCARVDTSGLAAEGAGEGDVERSFRPAERRRLMSLTAPESRELEFAPFCPDC